MKILKYILIVLPLIIFGVFLLNKKPALAPAPVANVNQPITLCFGWFSQPNERGFADKYTLRLNLNGAQATGELKFLPGEKDSKVGKFEGTVSAVDKKMMARTADLWWHTFGEGVEATEEIKIIFGEGTASLGAGELVDRGDGVYVYKDPENLSYTMNLTDVACSDLVARDNIENYVTANITKLSPVSAVLGGTWHVMSVYTDLVKSSGTVVYEDGHIQEIKNFIFSLNDKQEVVDLKIP